MRSSFSLLSPLLLGLALAPLAIALEGGVIEKGHAL
jgi:hypothetical protein